MIFEATKREEMLGILNKKYPNLFTKNTEEFKSDFKGGIWTTGESGIYAKDGFKLFDYYAYNRQKKYELGVHNEIGNLLEKHGWYAEWYDCGTIMLWQI